MAVLMAALAALLFLIGFILWVREPESHSLVGLAFAGMTLLAVAVTIGLARL
jgi:multisubunit Na+/H+ antiporter MnhC subunit